MLTGRMLLVHRALAGVIVSIVAAVACGHPVDSGHNSNTNWLKDCRTQSDCARGDLDCLCGKCTRPCEKDMDCSRFGAAAACVSGASCGSAVCAKNTTQLSVVTGEPGSTSLSGDASVGGSRGAAAVDVSGNGGRPLTPPVSSAGGAHPAVVCEGGNTPQVIVPSGVVGMHIALSDTHVYWANNSQIHRTPKAGGASEVVRGDGVDGRAPFIDSNRLYWGGPSMTIYGMPLDAADASPTMLANGIGDLDGWIVHGASVYFTQGELGASDQSLMMASSSDGTAATLAARMSGTSAIAADATGVYWYDDQRLTSGTGFIQKYTPATGRVTQFATVDVVRFIRTGGEHVIWDDGPSTGNRPTVVWSNLPDGSQPLQLGSAGAIYQLAADGTSAYYAAGEGGDGQMDLFATPLVGGRTASVACGVQNVYSLAVDENALYFSTWDATGSLSKVSKQ